MARDGGECIWRAEAHDAEGERRRAGRATFTIPQWTINGQSVEPQVHLRALFGERAANAVVAAKRVHDRRDVIRVSIREHKDMRSEWG